MTFRTKILAPLVLIVAVVAAATSLFACSQTPSPVPVRTFERAQRMDVVCVKLHEPPEYVEPRPVEECSPVAFGYSAGQYRLLAVVTQTTRGELAVVDLSAGFIADQNRATPGINFLPVGGLPTDVTSAPDGKMVFVSSAEPNKFAIYGLPAHRFFGDALGVRKDPAGSDLTSWPVCALPQRPGALTTISRKGAAAPAGSTLPDYEIVAVLPGDRTNTAKVVTIDPRPFLRGAPRKLPNDQPDPTYDDGQQPKLAPGSLAPCPITSAIELSGKEALPTSYRSAQKWSDGVAYVDGGVDLTCDRPAKSPSCGLPPCCGGNDGGADAGACEPVGAGDAGSNDFALPPLDPPHLVAIARDDHTVYIADDALPFIHVVDMTTPNAAKELPPYVASSLADPTRLVTLRDLAISPPTREYKRYLYGIDKSDGSIVVFDATDPTKADRSPIRRPHAELNPFQPEDRIAFSTPVVTLTFGRHDFPLSRVRGVNVANARTGVVCNPNPKIDGDPEGRDFGFFYRANSTDPIVEIGPRRLRGVFAFATLANGQIVTIDVDDWDAPCRRPANLTQAISSIAPAQPAPTSDSDFDPFHAPQVLAETVTDERIYPIVAPHRMRSALALKDDAKSGNNLPRIDGIPSVLDPVGVGLPLPPAQGSEGTPLMTPLGPATSVVGPSFSLEVPDVHINQDWSVVYEGEIPSFAGVFGTLAPETPDYNALVIRQPQGNFCSRGVEDWDRGRERAAQITSAVAALPTQPSTTDVGARFSIERLDRRISDYVSFDEDLLPPSDDWWKQNNPPPACWADVPFEQRYNVCARTFGSAADQKADRDFPILEAYDDHLVLGRYFTFNDPSANPPAPRPYREVVWKDPSNAATLRLAQCCFHNQARFKVRTGHSWAVVGKTPGGGSGVGFLNHFAPDATGRCVDSCNTRESLLNGRAPVAPPGTPILGRNNPLAFRNPMFSFLMVNGTKAVKRDTIYAFSSRGQFVPLTVDIAGSTFSVNPQSMRYVESLGQLALVDAASQGLVLVDLAGVTIARAPYF